MSLTCANESRCLGESVRIVYASNYEEYFAHKIVAVIVKM